MDYEFKVKYTVLAPAIDEDGEAYESEELRESIAVLDYISAPEPASFYDPGDPGEFEWHFELPNGDPDTFAEENCSDRDREIIEEYMTLGDGYLDNRNFRSRHGWND